MIVLTGATGFVGSQLLRLLDQHTELLLVSRDVAAARLRFPGAEICDYDVLHGRDLTDAVVIHLAARNNDRPGTLDEFRAVNVDWLLQVASIAKEGGAARFINLCSTHALEPASDDFYGLSKQEGARRLSALWPDRAVNLYLPAVYGDSFQGRLATLNRLPPPIRTVALGLLRLLKPTISIKNLATTLSQLSVEPSTSADAWRSEQYAADPISGTGFYAGARRLVDLLAVFVVMVLAGWVMVLIGIYIRFDSRGPSIFAQKRVGRNGRVFTCYKFRTMAVGTAQVATHDISATAVTRAGRLLRRTKLDELPQIFNVCMNDMSLIGPRPCLQSQTELVALREARGVLKLKPGITGLAQVSHIDMSDPARLAAWDDRYRAFRTPLADVFILLKTVLGGGSGDRIPRAS